MISLGVLAVAVTAVSAQTAVTVNGEASHAIPKTLYGQMFEDISSGDGGLYGELLQNRAFQKVTPGTPESLTAWHALASSTIEVVASDDPVSSALPNSLQLTIPAGSSNGGFGNEGYFGIKVDSSWTYKTSMFYKVTSGTPSGNITVALAPASNLGSPFASASLPISPSATNWTQVNTTLTPSSTPTDTANNFTVSVSGTGGDTVFEFALLSLFPPTFKNRENGMRMDIAQTLFDMNPSFFRFPGGNNLEGESIGQRWKWNETLGPLVDRPGRLGDWGYANTDGLGLMEYLFMCEDMDMEPFMAVWDGFSLDQETVTGDALDPYIQAAIDQINFVIGDAATNDQAAWRASLGHPDPFPLRFVEIGNEDFISNASTSTVQDRWNHFATRLKAEFPQLKFMATSFAFNPILDPTPDVYDLHVYQSTDWFPKNAFQYDHFERNGTLYFEGEYAAISTDPNDIWDPPGRLLWPTVQSAAGEAAFMTGFERNADIVFAASYAPLLQHVKAFQWTPDLISFDAGDVWRSTSYLNQQLFSVNRGEFYLPSTLPTEGGTLHWSVTTSNSTGDVFIKIANWAANEEPMTWTLPFDVSSSGTLQLLTGPANASNTPDTPDAVSVKNSTIDVGTTFNYTAPAVSVSVINLKTQ